MIKPEQIPTEVRAVFEKACDSGEPWNIADTIAAALNVWPGMEIEMVFMEEDYLILPLTQENNNGAD